VFLGTLAQRDASVWRVQEEYFRSFWIYDWQTMVGQSMPIFMPGGYVIGGALLINLLAAHAIRFKINAKRIGVLLIHGGLILILLGELFTGLFAEERQMVIEEGETKRWVHNIQEVELAIVMPSKKEGHESYVSIPQSKMREGASITHPDLLGDLEVRVEKFYANSHLLGPQQVGPDFDRIATQGYGTRIVAVPEALTVQSDKINIPSVYLTLSHNGQKLGTWLASVHFGALAGNVPGIPDARQTVTAPNGTPLQIELRFRREYRPYAVTLLDFTHEKYTGTEIPKNFSSRIRLVDTTQNEDREALIYMNHPLRYGGETFYQAAFSGEHTTILQVVGNPAWWIPYLSCVLVGGGMLVHFGLKLIQFLGKGVPA
jgi:hypothetical protein